MASIPSIDTKLIDSSCAPMASRTASSRGYLVSTVLARQMRRSSGLRGHLSQTGEVAILFPPRKAIASGNIWVRAAV
jgi:hypothetical protein